jgi:hypothetical protein
MVAVRAAGIGFAAVGAADGDPLSDNTINGANVAILSRRRGVDSQ